MDKIDISSGVDEIEINNILFTILRIPYSMLAKCIEEFIEFCNQCYEDRDGFEFKNQNQFKRGIRNIYLKKI